MNDNGEESLSISVSTASQVFRFDLQRKEEGDQRQLCISGEAEDGDLSGCILVEEDSLLEFHRALGTILYFVGRGRGVPEAAARARKKHERAYEPWTSEEDQRLIEALNSGKGDKELAKAHGRTTKAIRARIRQLGLSRPPDPA